MGSSQQGRTSRRKGLRYQNRVAKLLTEVLDRPFKRNLEEYRLVNDGDVAEEARIEGGELVNRPLPLWVECKRLAKAWKWKHALLEAIEGVENRGDGEIPLGWVRLERFLHPRSLDVVTLRFLDLRQITEGLELVGAWGHPLAAIALEGVDGKRPRWREPLKAHVQADHTGMHPVFRVKTTGDHPLDAAFVPEEDFLEILDQVHEFDVWPHLGRPPF